MPRFVDEVPVTYETITRPVATEVARELSRVLRLPEKINILFVGQTGQAAQPGSAIDGSRPDDTFGHDTRLKLEIQERAVEDRVLTMAVHQEENIPVFVDPALGVRIVPIVSMTEVLMSFTYRARSRAEAQKFRDDSLMRCANLRGENPLQMTYSYSIPNSMMHLLLAIHTLREAQAGYGEDFSTWLSNNITRRTTEVTTLAGGWPTLAIPETQVHNWGTFSQFVPSPDEPEKDKESGTWAINFNYRFQYDKVIGCLAVWPLVVHNQIIPPPWRHEPNASGTQVDPWEQQRRGSYSRHAMDYLAGLGDNSCAQRYGPAVIPVYDEWEPKHVRPDTTTMVQVLVGVNPEDLTDVMDLRDLGDYEIDAEVLEFMKGEAPFMHSLGESIFHVSLYENDRPQSDTTLRVSPFLRVTSVNPMELRKTYRLRLTLVTDLFFLKRRAVERLCNGGPAALKILMDLQFRLGPQAYRPNLVKDRVITAADFRQIAIRLNQHKRAYSNGREDVLLTVGNYHIVAQRRPSDGSIETESSRPAQSGPGAGNGTIVSRCDG